MNSCYKGICFSRTTFRPTLTIAAIGVVFGDIGTSPLYVVRECFRETPVTDATILGVASLIFWSLSLLVSIKYVSFLLNTTSHGEGGVFALFSLCRRIRPGKPWLIATGAIAGAALLYGDGIITPAISVLSAVEGLAHFSPQWEGLVVPLTCVILAALFLVQPLGTGRLGRVFGVVMIAWFIAIGGIGLFHILHHPEILGAVNPLYAIHLLTTDNIHVLTILGGVLLCITGAEALYADVGHLGKGPIRLGWWGLVKPCLLASYLGQLAWPSHHPEQAKTNPFFSIVPSSLEGVIVILAMAATVIASQALISGVFSLTEQGSRLGFLPRLNVVHTSPTELGQVYLPKVNWCLMAACLVLVLVFRSSTNLANAYGLAVLTGMTITSTFYFFHVKKNRQWPWLMASATIGLWLVLEIGFLTAASAKFLTGAWLPVMLTIVLVVLMQTWRQGMKALKQQNASGERASSKDLFERCDNTPRIPGTSGVLLSGQSFKPELLEYLDRFQALPEHTILVWIMYVDDARVAEEERYALKLETKGVHTLTLKAGFSERPDINAALIWVNSQGCLVDSKKTDILRIPSNIGGTQSQ